MISSGVHIVYGSALYDHLRAYIRAGFEQNRVHVRMRFNIAGLRLKRLSAAYFSPIRGYGAVQGHILGFEWRHSYAAPMQPAAQSRDQSAFPGI
jgi:hypothetical protein